MILFLLSGSLLFCFLSLFIIELFDFGESACNNSSIDFAFAPADKPVKLIASATASYCPYFCSFAILIQSCLLHKYIVLREDHQAALLL